MQNTPEVTYTGLGPEGGQRVWNPLENHKNIGFQCGPSLARQLNAIKMAFRWQVDDGPLLVVFGSSLPLVN